MDDEALARMLQEEEMLLLQGAQQAFPGAATGTAEFGRAVEAAVATALQCERKDLQERARAVIPLERMRKQAAHAAALLAGLGPAAAPGGSVPAQEDLLAHYLLQWFKYDFFKWVDSPPCAACGGRTQSAGQMLQPLPEELAHGAQRVEAHRCPSCHSTTRFPRYNDPGKLLEPHCRRGRCGEWANAFLLCCRAAGLTARYVRDWADHVWTEYYSHAAKRWIHMDSCEAAYDQPLLYEAGWGKAVAYVVAAGVWGVADVTPRYTAKWREVLASRRRLVPEPWLQGHMAVRTQRLRAGWPRPKLLVWMGRDLLEMRELQRSRLGLRADTAASQHLPGRQTGAEDWRHARGEAGTATTTGSGGGAAGGKSTQWLPAEALPLSERPEPLQQLLLSACGRVRGGACRAAGHNPVNEVVSCLFDGRTATKWLDFGGGGAGGRSWVEYRLPLGAPPVRLVGYDLVAANDCPERDPASWELRGLLAAPAAAAGEQGQDAAAGAAAVGGGSGEGHMEQWILLDSRTSATTPFPARNALRTFHLASPSRPLRAVRLDITRTADPAAANSVQLASWQLYGTEQQPATDSAATPASGTADAAATHLPGGDALHESVLATIGPLTGGGIGPGAVLRRMLLNLHTSSDPKYRKVRCAKLPAGLLQEPTARGLLLRWLCFRPMALPAGDGAAGAAPEAGLVAAGEALFLVLDDSSDEARSRVARALQLLSGSG